MRPSEPAHAGASRLGARPLVETVWRSHAGPASRRRRHDGADETPTPAEIDRYGLTPREREVLGLLADGRTNRQIADTLFISESTAGVHVSNIIGKLGVTNRVERRPGVRDPLAASRPESTPRCVRPGTYGRGR